MAINPVIIGALHDAAKLTGERASSPDGWRDQALKVDKEVVAPLMLPAPEVKIRDIQIPVPDQPPVMVRLYWPLHSSPTAALLTFFGGAFRQGGLHYPSNDALNRSRAADAGILVVAVDYALAPEHMYPAALHQGQAALRWLIRNAEDLGIDPGRIAIGGLSAGGNLAAGVAIANREAENHPVALQLLEVPILDLTGSHFQMEAIEGFGLPSDAVKQDLLNVGLLYLGGADPHDQAASPLLAMSLAGMPPAHVFTAELDVLRGDGEAYVKALSRAGVAAEEHRYSDMDHGSLCYTRVLPQARAWQEAVVGLLRELAS